MDFDGKALSELSDDELETLVFTWAGQVNASNARLLALIGEVQARESWGRGGSGFVSCVHWLSVWLGMAPSTAYEHCRVAHLLRSLPLVAAEMEAGRLSWTQVRAVTRLATVDTQEQWIAVARHATGAQLARLARGAERVRAAAEGQPPRPAVTESYDDLGMATITIRVPAETATIVMTALKGALDDLEREQSTQAGPGSPAAEPATDSPAAEFAADLQRPRPTLVDAVVEMSRSYLAGRHASAAARDRVALRVFQDPRTGWGRTNGGELLPPAVVARLADKAGGVRPLPRGTRDLGRLQREASAYQRALLEAVDGPKCAFPSCPRTRNLHAHHVTWFSRGGRTDFDNLVLLCHRHHNLIHDGVYHVELRADRTAVFTSAVTGRRLGAPPPPGRASVGINPAVHPRAAVTLYEGQPIDLGYAVSVLAAL